MQCRFARGVAARVARGSKIVTANISACAELRRTVAAKRYDVLPLLPDAPSTLGRLGAKKSGERASQAVANLEALPGTDPLKTTPLPRLQQELAELHVAALPPSRQGGVYAPGPLSPRPV